MRKIGKIIPALLLCLVLALPFGVGAMAEELPEDVAAADGAVDDGAVTEEDTNPFEELWELVTENAEKILAALTLAASMLVALAYKRGLLPLLRSALSAITEAVGRIKDGTDRCGDGYDELTRQVEEGLSGAAAGLAALEGRLAELTDEVRTAEGRIYDEEKMKLIITEQIELLYDIFMSSSLPHYQKEAVGERIAKMKEELVRNEES